MPRFTLGTLLASIGLVASVSAAHAGWFSEETPPANAKPLSEIIKSVEDKGYRTVTDVEFEDGVSEIEVHQPGGKEMTLKADPISGSIASSAAFPAGDSGSDRMMSSPTNDKDAGDGNACPNENWSYYTDEGSYYCQIPGR